MGKSEPQLPIDNQQQEQNHDGSFLFDLGSSVITQLLSFKCVLVLFLSVAVLLTSVFSIFQLHHTQIGFDAKDSIKNSATIQAYFRLQKPVSYLLPQITRLEYDVYAEIGVPHTQVTILSMHKASGSNSTHVVFSVLSDPINSTINPVSLSMLRSSLVDLFTQRSNLTLTTSIFGQPSFFDILKFPGGITVIPKQPPSLWMLKQALFNFTLPNSVREIVENFGELQEQLKTGLYLKPYESVYVQVTNKAGSTSDSPVTVQASIVSDLGNLVPLRLKQLAQTITQSSDTRNLGLDHSIFGKVKEISLSSYLYYTLDAPTPSPSPSPELEDHEGPIISPYPAFSPPQHSSHLSPKIGHEKSSPPLPHAPSPCDGFKIFPGRPPTYLPLPRHHSNSPPPTYQKTKMPLDREKEDYKGSAPPPV
ncbi:uncharacterized protein [Rutidosis leptorrhynchoides]|uniref:uncharacterized protein n=1 Tax=Rutidosis leptorrhynchoides TaxID=125765 RepID=UPI003A99E160